MCDQRHHQIERYWTPILQADMKILDKRLK